MAVAPRSALRSGRRALAAGVVVSALACGDGGVDATGGASATTGATSDASTTFAVDPPEAHTWRLSASFGADVGAIFSLWADGPETIMAVGGQPLDGVVLEYRGGAWVEDETIHAAVPRLNWVHGIGDFRVVVGYYGAIVHRVDGVWEPQMSGIAAPLWGVWGARPDDLWVVGGSAAGDAAPVLLHYDGDAWAQVDVSALAGSSRALFKVWGRAADDVFAVGAGGLILHYDGVAWAREASPTEVTLIGVDGDDDEVLVAGGRSSGVLLRRVAGAWERLDFPAYEGFDGAWIDELGAATVVGRRGAILHFAPEAQAWVAEESGVEDELHTVVGVPGGPVFAVGGRFDSAPYTGVILVRE
ncbi:MAG: hypothetical protein R3A79_12440 [Nannocystaceae bacterium]